MPCFHQATERFDELIQRQIAAGGDACAAAFVEEVFDSLTRHGFSRGEAEQYVAVFYQLRRAFYFISNSLTGGSPCMKQLRKRLWDNIFTQQF